MKKYLLLLLLLPSVFLHAASIERLEFTHNNEDMDGNAEVPSSFMLYIGTGPRGTCTRHIGEYVPGKTWLKAPDCYSAEVPLPDPAMRTILGQIFPMAGVSDGDGIFIAVTAWDDKGNESEYSDERAFIVNVLMTDEQVPPTKPILMQVIFDATSFDLNVDCESGKVCIITVTETTEE